MNDAFPSVDLICKAAVDRVDLSLHVAGQDLLCVVGTSAT